MLLSVAAQKWVLPRLQLLVGRGQLLEFLGVTSRLVGVDLERLCRLERGPSSER